MSDKRFYIKINRLYGSKFLISMKDFNDVIFRQTAAHFLQIISAGVKGYKLDFT